MLEVEAIENFTEVFPTELPRSLPPERFVDHYIDLLPRTKPFSRASYRLSKFETDEPEKVVAEILSQGNIRSSTYPWAAPVLFTPKEDGKLRFCVDYRALNKQTVQLWSTYQQVRIHPPGSHKTAFVTSLGHCEYHVVPPVSRMLPRHFRR